MDVFPVELDDAALDELDAATELDDAALDELDAATELDDAALDELDNATTDELDDFEETLGIVPVSDGGMYFEAPWLKVVLEVGSIHAGTLLALIFLNILKSPGS